MSQATNARRTCHELQLLAVREVLRATAAALPLGDILAVIANMAIIVSDASTSWIMLAEDRRLRTVVARGQEAQAMAGRVSALEAFTMGEREEPTILQLQALDPADPLVGPLAGGQQAAVLLPLRAGDRLLGLFGSAMAVEATRDASFLVTIAGQAAAAIERAHLYSETRAWRERLDAVFDRMAEAVVVYDGGGQVVLLNPAARELLDGHAGVGSTVADVLHASGLATPSGRPLASEQAAASRALRGEQIDNLEAVIPAPRGPARHLLISAVPLGPGGETRGAVVVGRDVTHIKELERMRAEFLSMVSHELRTPLTSVLGFAQLLQRQVARGDTPKDLKERLAVIVAQAKKLDGLVEDLLDVSRAEACRFTLKLQPLDLAELVRRTAQEVAALAPAYRLQVTVPPTPTLVEADPGRIEQVLRNLLDNAVKFSPPNSEIGVRMDVRDGHTVVAVTDQGPGIAKEDIASLFIPFHRLRQAAGVEVRGIGLGLYISRSIVEAHHGELWVRSRLGQGTTFHFSLPVAP